MLKQRPYVKLKKRLKASKKPIKLKLTFNGLELKLKPSLKLNQNPKLNKLVKLMLKLKRSLLKNSNFKGKLLS